jgi:hypothetical protein
MTHRRCYVSFLSGGSGKNIGFNLMGCAPDVLLVLSICRESEDWNSVGKDLVESQSRSRNDGSRMLEDRGSEVRDVRTSEKDLRQEEN